MNRDKNNLIDELRFAFNWAEHEYKILYENYPKPFITCVYRTKEEQNLLYKKKPKVTNAKGGQSPHNYLPCLAFDICFIHKNGLLSWEIKYFEIFADLIKKHSSNIVWGGDWVKFKDYPHFEIKNWKNYIDANK